MCDPNLASELQNLQEWNRVVPGLSVCQGCCRPIFSGRGRGCLRGLEAPGKARFQNLNANPEDAGV